ncbi:hypothetical protein ACJBUE_20760 (plasmid) [Ralstonia syzygii subsp. celebesensis]|uniref:Uncharacterized protein n=1 Tax=blood disease bacterium R229 TaxID=741978 RepID=G2ZVW7_9RALS|nr:hypothetical protein [Ralstonia syzygii]QQV57831.1 hypothetical protein JK151_20605 [Ralstonia syzygii subsp. celebesensis]CCA83248.1 hypothetical protein BDB_mp60414 [blood disease bacterium R229]
MSTTPIDNTENVIDSRDVIARIEELEDVETALRDDAENTPGDGSETAAYNAWKNGDEGRELAALKALADECEGYGDWGHGEALIHEDHFVEYIKELIDDCYTLPKELTSGDWPYRHITIDYEAAAEEAKVDYTEVDFDGQTYFLRS